MSKNDYPQRFLVKPGSFLKLADIDPSCKGEYENKTSAQQEIEHDAQRLRELQYLLYAEGRRSCLQGLDASGKDGTIRHVPGYMNPPGLQGTAIQGAHR